MGATVKMGAVSKMGAGSKTGWPSTSRHVRGYGAAWDKLRKRVLWRDKGLCQCQSCQNGSKIPEIATEVHHIRPKAQGGTDDMSNLQAVNTLCHKQITMRDNGATPRTIGEIGEDGWPITPNSGGVR